jgi:hypothetical protein
MTFCIQNEEPPKCPDNTTGKTGSEVCNREAMWAAKAAIEVSKNVSNMMPLTAIMNNVRSESKSMQDTISKLQNNLTNITQIKQDSRCLNKITQAQTNSIKAGLSEKCLETLGNLPKSVQDKILEGGEVSNVTQTNTAQAENMCKIDLVLDVLSEMDASIDNSTLQTVMNTSKGILAGASSEQTVCNDIANNMTACKYVHQTQCCSQEITQEQQNLLDSQCGGSFTNVIQSNNASAYNQCLLSASASITEKMKAAVKNVVSQTAENKAEGLTLDFIMIIIIIMFCIFFVAPFMLFKYALSKIFYIVGGIFIIVSFILGIVYIASKESAMTKYNKPYSGCTSFRALKSQLAKTTLGELKKFVANNNNVIGYDFFIDLPLDPKTKKKVKPTDETATNATDETEGMVFYMTVKPKESDNCIFDEEMAVISYVKARSKPIFLLISILLLIIGVVCIGVGLFKDFKSSKPVVPLDKTKSLTEPLAKTEPLASTLMKKFSNPTTTNSAIKKT